MSRKMTSKCDGCGVEVIENDDASPLSIMNAMRRHHGSERWGALRVATEAFPVSFDLCEKCIARVMALLELEMPKMPSNMGGHATLFPGGYIPMSPDNDLSRHLRSIPLDDSAFGAFCPVCTSMLLVRDGKPYCIKCSGNGNSTTCSSCGVGYKGSKPPICTTCGQIT